MMRILNKVSGVAVLFTTLAYGHLLHHFFVHASHEDYHNPLFWMAIIAALGAGIFSFIGACVLLKRVP
jgi:hypothetical protein